MTTITLNSTARHPTSKGTVSGIVSRFIASFAEFCAGARDGREIEARYNRLARMSNAELAQIGLSRPDIFRAALIGRPV